MAYSEASKPYMDYGYMQDYCGSTIDRGSNPPDVTQLTIDSQPIKLPREMSEFRIATPVFTAVVPDADYGRSIKDYLQMELPPGNYPTIVEGYFVLLRFKKPATYLVYSYANAGRETQGGSYSSELLYQIQVNNCKETVSIGHPGFQSERSSSIVKRIIKEKVKTGELLFDDAKNILMKVYSMSNTDAQTLLK